MIIDTETPIDELRRTYGTVSLADIQDFAEAIKAQPEEKRDPKVLKMALLAAAGSLWHRSRIDRYIYAYRAATAKREVLRRAAITRLQALSPIEPQIETPPNEPQWMQTLRDRGIRLRISNSYDLPALTIEIDGEYVVGTPEEDQEIEFDMLRDYAAERRAERRHQEAIQAAVEEEKRRRHEDTIRAQLSIPDSDLARRSVFGRLSDPFAE